VENVSNNSRDVSSPRAPKTLEKDKEKEKSKEKKIEKDTDRDR
jgi:hypothetical protein